VVTDDLRPAGRTRFDHDEIHARGECRQRTSVGQPAITDEPRHGSPQTQLLAPVERLLADAEVPAGAPPDLDHNELPGRAGIDRHEIQLISPDPDLPREHRPTRLGEPIGDQLLSRITVSLCGGALRHPCR